MRVAILALQATLAVLATDFAAAQVAAGKLPASPEATAVQTALSKISADLGTIDVDMHPDRKPADLHGVTVPSSVGAATTAVVHAVATAPAPGVTSTGATGVGVAAGANEMGRMPMGVDASGGNAHLLAKEQNDAALRHVHPVTVAKTAEAKPAVTASAALAAKPNA